MAAAHGGLRFLDCARRSRRAWMADWRRLGPTVRWRRRLRRTMADPLPADGAGTRVRTGDLPLTRRLLYQLRYAGRSEESRVGEECVSPGRSRWSPVT